MYIPQIEISVKFKGKRSELYTIKSSKDAYNVLSQIFTSETVEWVEELILLCLNSANKVLGYYKVSQGGIAGTVCDPKVIFTTALQTPGTTGLLIAHNHPSGSLQPSKADLHLTEKIKNGAKLLDMSLLDHIIYTTEGYKSLADEGLI